MDSLKRFVKTELENKKFNFKDIQTVLMAIDAIRDMYPSYSDKVIYNLLKKEGLPLPEKFHINTSRRLSTVPEHYRRMPGISRQGGIHRPGDWTIPVHFGKQYTKLANDLKKVKTKKDATRMWNRVNRFGVGVESAFGTETALEVQSPFRQFLCEKMGIGCKGVKHFVDPEGINVPTEVVERPRSRRGSPVFYEWDEYVPMNARFGFDIKNLFRSKKESEVEEGWLPPETGPLTANYNINPWLFDISDNHSFNPPKPSRRGGKRWSDAEMLTLEFGKIMKEIYSTNPKNRKKVKKIEKRILKFGEERMLMLKDRPKKEKTSFQKFIDQLWYVFTFKFLFVEKPKSRGYMPGENPVIDQLYAAEVKQMMANPIRPSNGKEATTWGGQPY